MIGTEKDRLSKEGLIGSIVVHLILLLMFLFMALKPAKIPPKKKGLLINFGTTKQGGGSKQPASSSSKTASKAQKASEAKSSKAPKKSQPKPVAEKKIQEFKNNEGPAIPQKDRKKSKSTKKVKTKKNDTADAKSKSEKAESQKAVEQQKKQEIIDEKAMFTGTKKPSNESSSQGPDDVMKGDVGIENGNPELSNNNGTANSSGMSSNGVADLTGRSLISLPNLKTNKAVEGVVVVRIKVDRNGKVISAKAGQGTTISDAGIRALSEKNAKSAKFNFAPDAAEVQTGTITYYYNLQ